MCRECKETVEATPREEKRSLCLRQFKCINTECSACGHLWWKGVPEDREAAAKCRECGKPGKAVPKGQERGVGVCKFICECGNTYTVLCELTDTAPCYECREKGKKTDNSPCEFSPRQRIQKKTDTGNTHNCSKCNGGGDCPNLR